VQAADGIGMYYLHLFISAEIGGAVKRLAGVGKDL
jgi:hypothetical protein